MERMLTFSSDDFDQWAFAISRRRRVPHGKTGIVKGRSAQPDAIAWTHVVVVGERHLRHLLRSYAIYYNQARTHLSVNKDAPSPRTVHAVGRIVQTPFRGGLHHLYVRV
jgi:hypothetical protein